MKTTTVYSGPGYPIDPMRQERRDLLAGQLIFGGTYNCVMVPNQPQIVTSQLWSLDWRRMVSTLGFAGLIVDPPELLPFQLQFIEMMDRCHPVAAPLFRDSAAETPERKAAFVHLKAKMFADKFFAERENDTLAKRKKLRQLDTLNANLGQESLLELFLRQRTH